MIFAKLDVCFYRHSRFQRAGFEASGLWAATLAYLRENDSEDGFIANDEVRRLIRSFDADKNGPKLLERLVQVGLFDAADGGYVLCRYGAKNETREEIDARKAATRQRVAEHRARKRTGNAIHMNGGNTPRNALQAAGNELQPRPPGVLVPGSGSDSGSGSGSVGGPGGAKPAPRGGHEAANGSVAKALRGARLPKDWQPSQETISLFSERDKVDASAGSRSAETFRNHWLAKSGKDALKVDWEATYRNWVIEDIARGRATRLEEASTAVYDIIEKGVRIPAGQKS